jgi:hypothetical protein
MKYITIPKPIELFSIQGDRIQDEHGVPQNMTFDQFVLGRLVDPAFGSDMAAVCSVVEIKTQSKAANGVLALENADWERLAEATRHGKYHPLVAHCLLPFMKAITEASSTKPKEH